MTAHTLRAYLGGSFNPPHLGHLAMAQAVMSQLTAQTSLMPSHNPFKDKIDDHRLTLLEAAINEFNHTHDNSLFLECIEIHSNSYPTYTLDTLQALQRQHPNDTLIFVLGQDSFDSIPNWKGGLELLNHCHLWIFGRNHQIPSTASCELHELLTHAHSKIYWDTTPIPNISSTDIRNLVAHLWRQQASSQDFYQHLTPYLQKSVIDGVITHKLYQI